MRKTILLLMLLTALALKAQVGEYRNDFAFGVNGGYLMSNIDFVPTVPQGYRGGRTGGVTLRYTCEKYFKSICAIVAEVNYAEAGWKEEILNMEDEPVINEETGLAEEYSRKVNYIQIPVMARMGWGRERNGLQAFFQIGPQIGIYLDESTETNFDIDNPNVYGRASHVSGPTVGEARFSNMYHMPVENKLDYGIAGGAGLEFSNRHIGHIMLEGRYYFGLGNIYGNTKRDYFARSNYSNIVVKLTYLFDIVWTKNNKIK